MPYRKKIQRDLERMEKELSELLQKERQLQREIEEERKKNPRREASPAK